MKSILRKEKNIEGEFAYTYILGIWGTAELVLWTWGQKQNTFRALRKNHSEITGEQSIILGRQGANTPWRGLTCPRGSLMCNSLLLGIFTNDNRKQWLGIGIRTKAPPSKTYKLT